MHVLSTEKIPIKMWLDDIEDGALQQARNLATSLLPANGWPSCLIVTKDMACPSAVFWPPIR